MEPQTNTGQYSIVTLTLLGVVMLILSSAIGAILGPVMFGDTNEEQIQAIPVPQVSSGGVVVGSPDQIYAIPGTVKSINGSSFVLHTQLFATDKDVPADRTVFVTNKTKIFMETQKDESTLQREAEEFSKRMKDAKSKIQLLIPPGQFLSVPADVSEISVGDSVTVTARENIGSKSAFSAMEIEIHSPIEPPAKK